MAKETKTVSQYIVDFLVLQKVDTVFLLTGGAISRVVDAMHGDERINYICMQHEQSAAMAADGYSRARPDSIGVTMSTSGPGFTNILTGVACSWFDSIPSLHISGQVNTFESKNGLPVRQRGFQETDSVEMVSPITKYAVRITDPNKIRYELEAAIYFAKHGRPGPTFIDLPFDISRENIIPDDLEPFVPPENKTFQTDKTGVASIAEGIGKVYGLLNEASRPLLLAGGGIKGLENRRLLEHFSEITKIPLVFTMNALGAITAEHHLNRGLIGVYGHRGANWCVAKSDLLICLGSRLDSRQTGTAPELFAKNAKKVVVDIDYNELVHSRVNPDLLICGDAGSLVSSLTKKIEEKPIRDNYRSWVAETKKFIDVMPYNEGASFVDEVRPGVNPYAFFRSLEKYLGEDDWVALDTGQNMVWGTQCLRLKANQVAFTAGGMSPMGYSFPAAIGVAMARGNKRTVAVIGDGGMQINIQELQTLYYHQTPVIVFVLNNESLGLIRQFGDQNFEGRGAATSAQNGYTAPSFSDVAFAYKIKGLKIENEACLDEIVELSMNYSGPVLVDVILKDKSDVLPKLSVNQPLNRQEPQLSQEFMERHSLIYDN